jgi:TPR repeat protein
VLAPPPLASGRSFPPAPPPAPLPAALAALLGTASAGLHGAALPSAPKARRFSLLGSDGLAGAAIEAAPSAVAVAAFPEAAKKAALAAEMSEARRREPVDAAAGEARRASVSGRREDASGGVEGASAMFTDASAQARLGFKALKGRRYGLALEWFTKASDQGDSAAMLQVALLHDRGRSLSHGGRDVQSAVHWYDRAARAGESRAMYRLAVWYRDGQGVAQDSEMSEQWMVHAAEAGLAAAQFAVAAKSAGQAREMPPKWAVRMEQTAAMWLQRGAAQGHGPCLLHLARRHLSGAGAAHDPALAVRLLDQAAHFSASDESGGGSARGRSEADGTEEDGRFEGVDETMAAETRAAAEYELAKCFRDGVGCEASPYIAASWMQRAADHDHPDAMFELSFM